ncbi:MAG: RtcB family protein [Treponema sp.]|jgi:tRNA-splicing ligase RtcB|nr:RtcB family protein [Treponema sp.]
MIQWENHEQRIPIKSWCADADAITLEQAKNLANHPAAREHISLMPDAHGGFGMPIGGVIACENAVIPNAVGVDIGCGMGALETGLNAAAFTSMAHLRGITEAIKRRIPLGEGRAHREKTEWAGFAEWRAGAGDCLPPWWTEKGDDLDRRNLGTLGGGNHFIEIQRSETGGVWVMLHSGSRNMGQRIASYYHQEAKRLNSAMGIALPDADLAFIPADHSLGEAYIRDMNHALAYALENRRLMMGHIKEVLGEFFPDITYGLEAAIHHNYAALEEHQGRAYWIHRKGATAADKGEIGIIPGSMGTPSYIVEGLGNPASFRSSSHGAGRRLSRSAANKTLTLEACDAAMEGIVYDRFGFSRSRGKGGEKIRDLSEAPLAYKDIDAVIAAEEDLVVPKVKLTPLAVIKG